MGRWDGGAGRQEEVGVFVFVCLFFRAGKHEITGESKVEAVEGSI